MCSKSVRVLLICDHSHEASSVAGFLETRGDRVQTIRAKCLRDLRRQAFPATWSPDFVVVVQTWPDQFAAADVIELLTAYPLARLVCLEGVWCDSIGRNRNLWPLACRERIEAGSARLAQELAFLKQDERETQLASGNHARSAGALALTASRGEVFGRDYAQSETETGGGATVLVDSPDRAFREMLEHVLKTAGYRLQKREDGNVPQVLVQDVDPWCERSAQRLAELQQELPATPVVACAGFPRPDLTDELLGREVAAVWFKLAPLPRLYAAISEAAARRPAGCGTAGRSSGRAPAG